jgi:hypothetical protein
LQSRIRKMKTNNIDNDIIVYNRQAN